MFCSETDVSEEKEGNRWISGWANGEMEIAATKEGGGWRLCPFSES